MDAKTDFSPQPEEKEKPRNRNGYRVSIGADRQIRTADLILTKDALYRLSYISEYGDREGARTLDLQRDRLAF